MRDQDLEQGGLPILTGKTPQKPDKGLGPRGEVGVAPITSSDQAKTLGTETRNRQRLEKARAESARVQRERIAAGLPARPDPIEKARQKPNSRALAIAGKCWDCEGGDADPHPRWRIGNCDIEDCPLRPVRPYQHLHGTPKPKSVYLGELDP